MENLWEFKWSAKDKKFIGWNVLYSAAHWSVRNKIKNEWHKFFLSLITKHKQPNIETFKISMEINSRFDIDNTLVMAKLFVDTLRKANWIKDDTPKYYKELWVKSNKSIPANTCIFTVHKLR